MPAVCATSERTSGFMKDRLQLLVVDDDVLDRMATRRALNAAHLDVEVTEAMDCASALHQLRSGCFDCALFDFQLPDGNALSLLQSLRAENFHLPVIILTGHGDERTAVELMKAGAADYLSKDNLTGEGLAQTLRNVLRIHEIEMRAEGVVTALRESENRFRTMADCSPVLIWEADNAGARISFNRSWLEFTGRSKEQHTGDGWQQDIHPEDRKSYLRTCQQALARRQAFHCEYRLRRADGKYGWVLENGTPLEAEDGSLQGLLGSGIDITERKQAEEASLRNQQHIAQLNTQLRESMKETHHRVKNSLQIIAAMVDMRLMDTVHPISEADLRQLGMHINSLAVVHELLTEQARQDGQGDFLMADDLLERLVPGLQMMAGTRSLLFDIAPVRLSARQANALPLVTNELVSNAIKYGKGDVSVTFRLTGSAAVLEVSDHGPGFPADFDASHAAHTGLELVERLSRWDLSGTIRYVNATAGGATVALTLPLDTFH